MKGLGEMDAEELNETTMDIDKRVLRKITVDDIVEADAAFTKLMGEEVEPRRDFIEENARYGRIFGCIGGEIWKKKCCLKNDKKYFFKYKN